MAITFFDDPEFQNILTALIVRDAETLRRLAPFLRGKDFQPSMGADADANYRWIVAQRALSFYAKYRDPIGQLLRSELISYAKEQGIIDRKLDTLLEYAKRITSRKLVGADDIISKVTQFKREKAKAAAVEELIELQSSGQLTDAAWLEISQKAVATLTGESIVASDYFADLEKRIERRGKAQGDGNPLFLIDPLDAKCPAIGRGHVGLILAPFKRGKSLFLIWLALAYTLQRLNVLYFTLEDPFKDVEDRFDAAATALPLHRLHELPNKVRRRFNQFKRLVRSRLRIYDGTSGDISIERIEEIYQTERNSGFIADAIIIDYDDEIVPPSSAAKKERRFQFAEIYQGIRKLAAKHNAILWTAAQTRRGTGSQKVISADDIAEDISKIRKVTLAISLGVGEWGEESMHLWIAACRIGRQHDGCTIMTDKARMLIYDRDKTREMLLQGVEDEE